MSWFVLILILVAAFLIIHTISGSRVGAENIPSEKRITRQAELPNSSNKTVSTTEAAQ